jgi:hypothetical protein
MLQAGRSGIRVPMRSSNFSTYLILPASLWPWDLLSLEQKRVPEYISEGKARPARKVDNLTAIYEQTV